MSVAETGSTPSSSPSSDIGSPSLMSRCPSLAAAEVLAAQRGLADRIGVLAAGIEDLPAAFERGRFDVVLCHNVIQYLPDPQRAIAVLAGQLNATGLLSVIAPNAAADPLLAAVRNLDPEEALRLLDSPTRHTVTYGAQTRACFAEDAAGDLASAGLRVLAHCGIRAVCDLIVDDARKADPDFYDQLERLELVLATRDPYIHTARFFQLIAAHPDPAVLGVR
ncbi:methyltransferase domain-containing protein [Nocardia puris]|uniref:methyltransferase domain-containing protein n=1 Tax=Nocardia puris TaxID=208602 RepID=UPI001894A97C|nr:methyltransferase domain-containing protein [Nocardia puris]MBF6216156.1 methyltransferase domain-containing protein [Nocardia puris]